MIIKSLSHRSLTGKFTQRPHLVRIPFLTPTSNLLNLHLSRHYSTTDILQSIFHVGGDGISSSQLPGEAAELLNPTARGLEPTHSESRLPFHVIFDIDRTLVFHRSGSGLGLEEEEILGTDEPLEEAALGCDGSGAISPIPGGTSESNFVVRPGVPTLLRVLGSTEGVQLSLFTANTKEHAHNALAALQSAINDEFQQEPSTALSLEALLQGRIFHSEHVTPLEVNALSLPANSPSWGFEQTNRWKSLLQPQSETDENNNNMEGPNNSPNKEVQSVPVRAKPLHHVLLRETLLRHAEPLQPEKPLLLNAILIDDRPESFIFTNPWNGLLVTPFFGGQRQLDTDTELWDIIPKLEQLIQHYREFQLEQYPALDEVAAGLHEHLQMSATATSETQPLCSPEATISPDQQPSPSTTDNSSLYANDSIYTKEIPSTAPDPCVVSSTYIALLKEIVLQHNSEVVSSREAKRKEPSW